MTVFSVILDGGESGHELVGINSTFELAKAAADARCTDKYYGEKLVHTGPLYLDIPQDKLFMINYHDEAWWASYIVRNREFTVYIGRVKVDS